MTASNHAQWLKQAARGNMTIPELFDAAAALTQQGQSQLAIDLYRTWLEHTKRSPLAYAAWFNLGAVLAAVNDDEGAEAAYRKSIALQSRFIEGRLNLGTLLERRGKPQEALDMWRSILGPQVKIDKVQQRGLYLQTLNNLGRLLEIQKQYPEAEEMLAQSLRVDPSQVNVMTHWVHLRQKQCHWPTWAGLEHISRKQMEDGASALAMLSLTDNPDLQKAAALRFVRDKMNADVAPLTQQGQSYGHSRLRVAYLSSDLCSHAVSILTAELYGLHDRGQFEVYAFSWSRDDGSPLRARVVAGMDHYIPIHTLSDEQAAQLIRAHEIDILVDLHGLTSGARPQILAYHPAPVQMTWLGFPGTTGLPGVDYVIADDFLITPEMEKDFTEKPLRLPDTFQINDRQRLIGFTPTRASVNLPEDAFVFCSFSNSYKYKPELFAHWMNILRRVPNSVLWLVADTPLVGENLKQHAREAGIDPERLIFATRALPADYLARYRVADLFLDTYPFNGGTTASDALWAGLPVLTCSGPTFASRMAGSLLRAVDLPQLITTSFADYEELAVALANDPSRIAAMKRQLNDNRMSCALFDTPRLVRNLEAAMKRVAAPIPSKAMNPIDQIPMIAVSYNAPDLIASLLSTFRQHYPHNPVTIIDGSAPEIAVQIAPICAQYAGVDFKPFGYNIHHGPGMAWAIENLDLKGRVLFLDSDVEILKRGFLESLDEHLEPQMYGVGNVTPVDENGFSNGPNSMPYLHPACMLTNIEVVRQWPLPVKHGAPMLPPMIALAKAGKSDLLRNVAWVNNDFGDNPAQRIFIRHDWQGTVRRTGGYHYDKPSATQINAELLSFVPPAAVKVVQLGCGDGAFAKAYKQINAVCNYTGIERDPIVAEQARAHCDFVYSQDFETPDEQRDRQLAQANCWVLDGALERVRDPWAVLEKIRSSMAPDGTLVLSVRNVQHWSVQVRLNMGDYRYRPDGVLQKDELRQFTRGSLLELLAQTGFRLTGGAPVIRDEAGRDTFLPILRQLAVASGSDPELSVQDALAQRYIITAVPA
ncbi:putative O-linked N-acetylglucosamine transferase (SPINDLY family)/SAM-dependent methyltransferase [Duganella sp. SG902]|uniref:O-linked N-acetylglucosamine transferase family protein n=1 Tax=Duganella sp. SG902 TaxID=2587016 RepID=UPI00159EB7A1|nr:methyltransferase domain-containing protein [Duganella sp. SG902]NVM79016.1 putative O-linked N-acetylglucosamine transferase (SPINDLY family)/SAM-dependent methyltransferase [Duganella sp. SG902]